MAEVVAPKLAEEELLRMTADVVAAYVSNNHVAHDAAGARSSMPSTAL